MKKEFSKKIKPIVDRIVSENDKFEITKIGGIRKCTCERDKGMFFQLYVVRYKFSKPYLWPAYEEWDEQEVGRLFPMQCFEFLEVLVDENGENIRFNLYSPERDLTKSVFESGVWELNTVEEVNERLEITANYVESILLKGEILQDLYKEFDIEIGYEYESDNFVQNIHLDNEFIILKNFEKIEIRRYSDRDNYEVIMQGEMSKDAYQAFYGQYKDFILVE